MDGTFVAYYRFSSDKFTDWVERDAGLRPRGSARFGSLVVSTGDGSIQKDLAFLHIRGRLMAQHEACGRS
jgi:hypothetical protein